MTTLDRESWFSYPLTRRYPLWWFDWVAGTVLVLFTTVFTIIAVAADGYVLDSIYVSDANTTLAEKYWFQHAPISWLSPTKATCQPTQLTQGGVYFTSNRGLMYTIQSIQTSNGLGGDVDGGSAIASSISYFNTPLLDCNVDEIEIAFARSDFTRLPLNWWSWSATTARASLHCSVMSENGAFQVEFDTSLPSTFSQSSLVAGLLKSIVALNFTERPAMWFGAQITQAWYGQLVPAMGWQAPPGESAWDSGIVYLSPNPNSTDSMSEGFFLFGASFATDSGGLNWNLIAPMTNWTNQWLPGYHNYYLPNISIEVDAFAKSFYSLILSDFGVMNGSNALATPAGVQYLQSRNDTQLVMELDAAGAAGIPNISTISGSPGTGYPLTSAWQDAVSDAGYVPNLAQVNASTIFAQYLCSVPKMKSGINLVISIIIADVVFLQVIWKILNITVQFWLGRKDSEMNTCVSCRRRDKSPTRTFPTTRIKMSSFKSSGDEYQLLHARP